MYARLPKQSGSFNVVLHNQSAILDGLKAAVLLIDDSRLVLLANRAAVALFGADLEGRDIVHAVRHPGCLEAINEVFSGQKTSQTVITLSQPVQTTLEVNVIGVLQEDSLTTDHNPARAVVSFEDISHIREAEQMRSDFVANVSHELRSPLTALSGFIETLKGPARNDEMARERFLDIMEGEALRMDRLISDLLSLSKVEVNAFVRPTDMVDVRLIVETVITALSSQADKERKIVALSDKNAGNRLIPGDQDQLTQVFQNLIENAIKYGAPDSEITVTITRKDRAAGVQGPVLSVAVRDHGAGIPPHHIPRLTERFYRVDNSRSREKGGTGLGLAIVKHIVIRHRGRLQIRSEPDIGSTFTVLLPARL